MDVQLFDIALKLRCPIATSKGLITQRDGIALFIRDGTHHGWGEAMCLPNWPESNLAAIRQALEGWAQKPHPQKLPTERFAKGAVEVALCNLEAQRSKLLQCGSNAHLGGNAARRSFSNKRSPQINQRSRSKGLCLAVVSVEVVYV